MGRGSADGRTGSAKAESVSSLSNRLNRREVLGGHDVDTVGRRNNWNRRGEIPGGGVEGGGGAVEEVTLRERASERGLLRGLPSGTEGGERQIVCIPITMIIILPMTSYVTLEFHHL